MVRFVCSSCGETHEGAPDLAFEAPYPFYRVPEAERGRRCTLSSDFCSIDDEDFFIRGCLEIPVAGLPEPFALGAWCSLSKPNYDRCREIFDEPHRSHVGPFFGWLSVRVPTYPDTLLLKVRAHLRDHGRRPSFELEPTEHPLAVDQRTGITMTRLEELYAVALHPPSAPE